LTLIVVVEARRRMRRTNENKISLNLSLKQTIMNMAGDYCNKKRERAKNVLNFTLLF
jgi:hypothetical protein